MGHGELGGDRRDGSRGQGDWDGDRRKGSRGPGEGSLWEPLLHLCTGTGARWPSGMSKICKNESKPRMGSSGRRPKLQQLEERGPTSC